MELDKDHRVRSQEQVRRRRAATPKWRDKSSARDLKYPPTSAGFTPVFLRQSKSSNITSDQYTSLQKVFIETSGFDQPRDS